tara:strand:+ start:241 stop:690 length:450 start_codon:yes stop_codon:yes gene_type:complete
MNFWEDNYRVEEDGEVYNIKSGKKIKPWVNKSGYEIIGPHINGKRKKMYIHRLVALTYIPNEDGKPQVDHIDRNRLNNHFTNLRWVTHLENHQNKELGKTGERNILFNGNGLNIKFRRNNLNYWKYIPKSCTLEQAIIQRDLMLSMFII